MITLWDVLLAGALIYFGAATLRQRTWRRAVIYGAITAVLVVVGGIYERRLFP